MQFPKIELPKFERKIKEADPPGVTVPAWLVRATKFASWVATFALIYFLWLYTLDVARDRAEALHLTRAGSWAGELFFWFPHIVGFAVVAFGIPYVAKIAIPTFVSLNWRDNFTAKIWSLFIAIAVSLVVISGTFAVQGHTIMERDRDAAVAVEGVQQEAAVLASRIRDKRQELDDMVNNASVYIRTAASMSPEAYDAFVEQRRNDWQYDRLLSYRATSVDAQRLRDEIAALRDQQARQTAVASVTREVVTEQTGWISQTLGWLEGVRAILLSFVMDIVALIMPLIALRLEQARNRQLGLVNSPETSGWAPEGLRIEDLRAQEPIERNTVKMETQVRATNAETGEEEVLVKPRPYWRKAKRGKPTPVEVTPEIPPDETGVRTDGGNRIALGADGKGGVMESEEAGSSDHGIAGNGHEKSAEADAVSVLPEGATIDVRSAGQSDEQADAANPEHPEPSNLSEDDLAVLYPESAAAEPIADGEAAFEIAEQGNDDAGDEKPADNAEGDFPEPVHREPQTDPSKLIAAE
jgi:hypothetical protein